MEMNVGLSMYDFENSLYVFRVRLGRTRPIAKPSSSVIAHVVSHTSHAVSVDLEGKSSLSHFT